MTDGKSKAPTPIDEAIARALLKMAKLDAEWKKKRQGRSLEPVAIDQVAAANLYECAVLLLDQLHTVHGLNVPEPLVLLWASMNRLSRRKNSRLLVTGSLARNFLNKEAKKDHDDAVRSEAAAALTFLVQHRGLSEETAARRIQDLLNECGYDRNLATIVRWPLKVCKKTNTEAIYLSFLKKIDVWLAMPLSLDTVEKSVFYELRWTCENWA